MMISYRRELFKTNMMLNLYMRTALVNFCLNSEKRVRAVRRLQRNTGWYDNLMNYSDARFKQCLRVSKGTFEFVLSKIEADLQRKSLVEEPISPSERLAIGLYKLARGDYNYTLSEMTGHGESTIRTVVMEVCAAVISRCYDHVRVHFPTTENETKEAMLTMGSEWQFQYAYAAIDGSHIPIKCPPGGAESKKEYYNFKGFYSVVLLALVDAKLRFMWFKIGAPGNTHDSTLFQGSQLFRDIEAGEMEQFAKGLTLQGVVIPPLILGDGAFPLRPFISKPYSEASINPERRYFNYRLSRARMVSECAFGLLKSRWRVLM